MSPLLKSAALTAALVFLSPSGARAQGGGAGAETKAALPDTAVFAHCTAEAVKYTDAAIVHGTAGRTDSLARYVQLALTHAKLARDAKPNPGTESVIKSLEEAIAHGNMGHSAIATTAARTALGNLRKT